MGTFPLFINHAASTQRMQAELGRQPCLGGFKKTAALCMKCNPLMPYVRTTVVNTNSIKEQLSFPLVWPVSEDDIILPLVLPIIS